LEEVSKCLDPAPIPQQRPISVLAREGETIG
jgi:hypothetical protein